MGEEGERGGRGEKRKGGGEEGEGEGRRVGGKEGGGVGGREGEGREGGRGKGRVGETGGRGGGKGRGRVEGERYTADLLQSTSFTLVGRTTNSHCSLGKWGSTLPMVPQSPAPLCNSPPDMTLLHSWGDRQSLSW